MKDRRKRNIIIGSLACLLVFMSVGYAILSATLNIKGTSIFEGNWDIIITNVEMSTTGKGVTGTYSDLAEDNKNLTLSVELQKPKDEVIYTITVKNQGSVDASLKAVNLESTNANEYIEAINTAELGTALFAGQSMTFDVKIRFRDLDISTLPGNLIAQYNFSLTYLQYTESSIAKNQEGLSNNSSFSITPAGQIYDYDYSVGGEYVTIPSSIDGIKVTDINKNIFKKGNVLYYFIVDAAAPKFVSDGTEAPKEGYIIKDEENFEIIKTILAESDSGLTNYYHVNEIYIPNAGDSTILKKMVDIENRTVTIPNEYYKIKYLNLSNVDISEISASQFVGLGIEELILPKKLTTIGQGAFADNNIKNLIIPNSVTSVGKAAFGSNKMQNVQILNPDLDICSTNIFEKYGINGTDTTIQTLTLDSKIACSSGATSIKNLRLLNSVKQVKAMEFDSKNIETVTIGKNVETIGDGAFVYNKLKTLTIPSSVKSISNSFGGNQLETVVIENGVETIGNDTFAFNKLTSITLPKSVKTIGERVFAYNPSSENPNPVTVTLKGRKSTDNDITIGTDTNANYIYELD